MTLRIPSRLRLRLIHWAMRNHTSARVCDFCIGSRFDPYLMRWYVIRNGRRWLRLPIEERFRIVEDKQNGREEAGSWWGYNVYVHEFWRSDDDRALHDHPWPWITILLFGSYIEHLPADPRDPTGPTQPIIRRPGDIVVRANPRRPHRVELFESTPVMTLFITGPKIREWGFWCPQGWRHWRKFTAPGDSGQVGRGCE